MKYIPINEKMMLGIQPAMTGGIPPDTAKTRENSSSMMYENVIVMPMPR